VPFRSTPYSRLRTLPTKRTSSDSPATSFEVTHLHVTEAQSRVNCAYNACPVEKRRSPLESKRR
jgi:hypothetical protein